MWTLLPHPAPRATLPACDPLAAWLLFGPLFRPTKRSRGRLGYVPGRTPAPRAPAPGSCGPADPRPSAALPPAPPALPPLRTAADSVPRSANRRNDTAQQRRPDRAPQRVQDDPPVQPDFLNPRKIFRQ